MTRSGIASIAIVSSVLAACQPAAEMQSELTSAAPADTCGAAALQSLVGGPSSATAGLDIPPTSRHYGSEERVATDDPSRINFVHSGTAIESVINPNSKVIRVFCG